MALPWLRLAPYIGLALLALAVFGLWQRGKVLKMERDQAQAAAQSYEKIVAAEKARQRELEKLRRDYDEATRKLRAISDDGCLDRAIPDDLRMLFHPNGKAASPGAGTSGGS